MVARTPPKLQQRHTAAAPLNPILLRQILNKVDKCMASLEELQYTVKGRGKGVSSGVVLSPRSTRAYSRTSHRCKQESLRIRNATSNKSPQGKLPINAEWKRMSLPAMLLGETVNEILQASQLARKVVEAAASDDNPKTPPLTIRRNKNPIPENSELIARRKREKEHTKYVPAGAPSIRCARSRINFKRSPPLHKKEECENENLCKYIAKRVSPRKNRPWARKTVLFPNPLFHTSPPTSQQKLGRKTQLKTPPHKFLIKSPPQPPFSRFQVKIRNPPLSISPPTRKTQLKTPPHKFLIKSPPQPPFSRSQVKIRTPPLSISPPTRRAVAAKKSPQITMAGKLKRLSFSPSRLANRLLLVSSSPSKMRRSFSPSRLAKKLVSPLRSSRKSVQENTVAMKMMMSGLKQQRSCSAASSQMQFPARRL
ncbi:unnamed protein product [Cuscuta europaea]|uniref:Uncharacterized protein n=1 Tax=Cuscuta europaea TaxID=41803 RepID=A0A9P0Z5A5_CUSEU|nr:unnamed protein product [Cuscuta europaea]